MVRHPLPLQDITCDYVECVSASSIVRWVCKRNTATVDVEAYRQFRNFCSLISDTEIHVDSECSSQTQTQTQNFPRRSQITLIPFPSK